jgi:hypothetical protein
VRVKEFEGYVDVVGRKFIKYYVIFVLVRVLLGLLFISIAAAVGYLVLLNVVSSYPKINI